MRGLIILASLCIMLGCNDDPILQERVLADYIELNDDLELTDLVACAGGKDSGLMGTASFPTDVFFYPIPDATDFRYFEAANIADSTDFSKYVAKELEMEPVFNGYLWKFNNEPFSGERMGIVTYKTPGKIHVCSPIRHKTTIKPTETNDELVTTFENEVTPSFTWIDGNINENVIYFQVITDQEDNLISGTYTYEKEYTFYDLENVVFNITDPNSNPTLQPNKTYKFILMGISEDNWINFMSEKEFETN